MCILAELNLILGVLPQGPDVRFTLSPPFFFCLPLPLFSVEQTETELPPVEQLARCIEARLRAALCHGVIVLFVFNFFFFFQQMDHGSGGGEFELLKDTLLNERTCLSFTFVMLAVYFKVQVCILAHVPLRPALCPC